MLHIPNSTFLPENTLPWKVSLYSNVSNDQHNYLDHVFKDHASFKQWRFLNDAKPKSKTAKDIY